jgi:hypothetical protein
MWTYWYICFEAAITKNGFLQELLDDLQSLCLKEKLNPISTQKLSTGHVNELNWKHSEDCPKAIQF